MVAINGHPCCAKGSSVTPIFCIFEMFQMQLPVGHGPSLRKF